MFLSLLLASLRSADFGKSCLTRPLKLIRRQLILLCLHFYTYSFSFLSSISQFFLLAYSLPLPSEGSVTEAMEDMENDEA